MATNTLTIGGYTIDPTWKYITAGGTDTGSRAFTVFNPNDPTQNFTTSNTNQILSYLGSQNVAQLSDAVNLGLYTMGENNYYNPTSLLTGYNSKTGGLSTYEQLAEQQRLASLANNVTSGTTTVAQGEQLANDPTKQLTNIAPYVDPDTTRLEAERAAPGPASGVTAFSPERQAQQETLTQSTTPPPQSISYDSLVNAQQGMTPEAIAAQAQKLVSPLQLNPSTQIDSSQLTATPRTNLDIQSLIAQNQSNYSNFIKQQQALQQQYLNALKPDPAMTKLQQQLNDLKNQMLNTNLSAEAGIQQTSQRLAPMRAIIGEQQNIVEQANLKLKTLAAMQAPLVDQLQLAQTTRTQQLKSLEALMSFGLQNYQAGQEQLDFLLSMNKYQKELEQLAKSEQDAAKNFALENGITKQFYEIGGTIYRASDGKAYSTPEAFFADGGAKDWSNVQKIEPGFDLKQYPVSYQEYLLAKQEGFNGSYNDYQTMDANRKAVRSTTNIYAGDKNASAEEKRVNQIIAAHPGEWGNAANQIDQEFGAGTATKYDDLLKAAFSPDALKRQTASTVDPQTLSDLNADIAAGASLSQLYDAYSELSPELIQSIYYNR